MAGRDSIQRSLISEQFDGMLDLNSIAIGVSPAFSLHVEHPTGGEYASHLRGVAKFFELPIQDMARDAHLRSCRLFQPQSPEALA